MPNFELAAGKYNNATIEAIRNFHAPTTKLPGVVVSQTVPAGTQVKKGETIGVTLVSPSDVDLGSVVIPDFDVPVAIRKTSVGEIIELGKKDQVIEILAAPTDPVKQQAYVAVVNQELGTSFGLADVPALLTLQKTFNAF